MPRHFGLAPHAAPPHAAPRPIPPLARGKTQLIEDRARITTAYRPVNEREYEPSVSPLMSFIVGLLFVAVIALIGGVLP